MMILPIGNPRSDRAFTLIELILVMTILVIVVGVTFPTLRGFFQGRTLESEARRLLALTRYGQSRAVSEGIPMTLWVDAAKGTYGLEAQTGYMDRDDRAVEYNVDEKLKIEVDQNATANPRFTMTREQQERRRNSVRSSGVEIRFAPDGSVDTSSPQTVAIRRGEEDALWVTQSEDRLKYEVRTQEP
jgi:prepilin-type N-terminal cleavage/methylation domain-containing protein